MKKVILDNHHENVNLRNLYLSLLYQEEARASRVFLLLSFLLSFVLLFYSSINFSCQLSLVQNALLPFLIVQDIRSFYILRDHYEKIKLGFIIGVIAGIIPAITINIVSTIRYYFLDYRSVAFFALGKTPPEISLEFLYIDIGSQVVIVILLVFLSAFSGVISSLITKKK